MKTDTYTTATEAIKKSGLDFEVRKVAPLFVKVGSEEVKIPDKFATVRMDKNIALGIVGNVYLVTQNKDAFSFLDTVANHNEMLFTNVHELYDGVKIAIQVRLGDEIGISNEKAYRTLILSNAHDGTAKTRVKFVIENKTRQTILPFSLPGIQSSLEVKHTTNAKQKLEEGVEVMKAAHAAFNEAEKIFEKFSNKTFNAATAKLFLTNLFQGSKKTISTRASNIVDTIMVVLNVASVKNSNLPNSVSLWNLYNAIAEYVDSQRGSKKKDESDLVNSRWFGSGNSLKEKSFTELVKLI